MTHANWKVNIFAFVITSYVKKKNINGNGYWDKQLQSLLWTFSTLLQPIRQPESQNNFTVLHLFFVCLFVCLSAVLFFLTTSENFSACQQVM